MHLEESDSPTKHIVCIYKNSDLNCPCYSVFRISHYSPAALLPIPSFTTNRNVYRMGSPLGPGPCWVREIVSLCHRCVSAKSSETWWWLRWVRDYLESRLTFRQVNFSKVCWLCLSALKQTQRAGWGSLLGSVLGRYPSKEVRMVELSSHGSHPLKWVHLLLGASGWRREHLVCTEYLCPAEIPALKS